MKFNVLKFVTNIEGGYQVKCVSTHDNLKAARVSYLGEAKTLVNANDVLYAVVKIVDEYGNETQWRETVDNRPKPEPEPLEDTKNVSA